MVLGATMWKGFLMVVLLGVQPLLAILLHKKVFHSHITVWEIVSNESCFLKKTPLTCDSMQMLGHN